MIELEALPQRPLSVGRCARLALDGVRYRLLRSTVTMATLALAVAFAGFAGGGAVLQQRTAALAVAELAPSAEARRWLSRLRGPDESAFILRSLQRRDPDRLGEYHAWLGGDGPARERLARGGAAAREYAVWEAWVGGLEPAAAASLLGGEPLSAALDRWAGDEAWARFLARLDQWGYRPPGEQPAIAWGFVRQRWPELREAVEAVRAGHARSVAALRALGPAQAAGGLPSLEEVTQAGFLVDAATWSRVEVTAEQEAVRGRTIEAIRRPEVRATLGRRLGLEATTVSLDTVFLAAGEREGADAIAGLLADASITGEALHALAGATLWRQRLEALLPPGREPGDTAAAPTLPRATLALLGLSLLVCVVGVGNAMLMSVAERFTEIATMKCLGALDGSIRLMFLAESLVLGLVGGAAGLVLGLVLAVGRGVLRYGGLVLEAPGVGSGLVVSAALAAAVGVVLAVVAAIGPAWWASRLAPMEAMRVE